MRGRKMAEATFGERLRAVRQKKGITKTDLAEACGLSRKTIFFWEKGLKKTRNYYRTAELLSLVLHVPIDYWFDEPVPKSL